jgi:hypothetical protein
MTYLIKNYTANQLGAIATQSSGAMWSITAYATGQVFEYARPEFGWPIIIVLILILPYVMRIRPSYIVGIIMSINGLILTFGHPIVIEAPPWYKFTQPLLDFTFAIVCTIMIVNIYFSYKTFKELGEKVHLKPAYTNNQVGAISTFLAMLIWGTTSQGFEVEKGIALPILLTLIIMGWILLPFYIKRIKPAFIMGLTISILLLIGISITHSLREQAEIFPNLSEASPLYTFSTSLYYFIFSIIYLVIVLCAFFSYVTYKELK